MNKSLTFDKCYFHIIQDISPDEIKRLKVS